MPQTPATAALLALAPLAAAQPADPGTQTDALTRQTQQTAREQQLSRSQLQRIENSSRRALESEIERNETVNLYRMQDRILRGLFYTITTIVVSIIAWTVGSVSYPFLGMLAFPFAAIIWFGALAGNAFLVQNRWARRSALTATLFIIFQSGISLPFLFSYFYENYANVTVYAEQVEEIEHQFQTDLLNAEVLFNKYDRNQKVRYELDVLLDQLADEMSGPIFPGYGPAAQSIIQRVDRLLGSTARPVYPTTVNANPQIWLESYINETRELLARQADSSPWADARDAIDIARIELMRFDDITDYSSEKMKERMLQFEILDRSFEHLEIDLNFALRSSDTADQYVLTETEAPMAAQSLRFPSTIRTAISRGLDSIAIMALAVSFFLTVIPSLFALLLVSGTSARKKMS